MATDLRNRTDTEPRMTNLVKGVIDDVQKLTKQQLELFKQELQEDFSKTRTAALPMLAGLGVMLIGTLLLGITLALLLQWALPHMPYWAAFAIVTVLMVGTGAALFYAGMKKFETFNPLPDRTLDALKDNVQSLTGAAKP